MNALLGQFGLSVTLVGRHDGSVTDAGGRAPRPALFPASVHGGTPSLTRKDGKPVLASAGVGKGQVTVYGDGALFSSANMGSTAELPSPYKRSVYEFEYWLLRSQLGLRASPPSLDCGDRGHGGLAALHDASSTDIAAP